MKKNLQRSKKDRIFAGVCGGIAEYFQINSFFIRIIAMIIIAISGWGIFLYIILWLTIPQNNEIVP